MSWLALKLHDIHQITLRVRFSRRRRRRCWWPISWFRKWLFSSTERRRTRGPARGVALVVCARLDVASSGNTVWWCADAASENERQPLASKRCVFFFFPSSLLHPTTPFFFLFAVVFIQLACSFFVNDITNTSTYCHHETQIADAAEYMIHWERGGGN